MELPLIEEDGKEHLGQKVKGFALDILSLGSILDL